MPFLGIEHGKELIYDYDPSRTDICKYNIIYLPEGSIKKLIGRKLKPTEGPFDLSLIINNHGKF